MNNTEKSIGNEDNLWNIASQMDDTMINLFVDILVWHFEGKAHSLRSELNKQINIKNIDAVEEDIFED